MPRTLLVAFGILALSPSWLGQADVIRLVKGGTVIGKIREEGEQGVTFNVYRTALARAKYGTDTAERKNIKSLTKDPHPHRGFWKRAEELHEGTAQQWLELGRETKGNKLPGLARHAFTEAWVREPNSVEAAKELGEDAKRIRQTDPRLNLGLAEKLTAYLGMGDDSDRTAVAAEIGKIAPQWTLVALERARRSAKRPKGRKDDQLLTIDAKLHSGGVYTLLVPKSYDPLRPTPLVVGLHGGGAGGKDRTNVVGSGSSAMNFFQSEVERMGWIVVCPTALRAPWADEANDPFLLAILEEICALYHVDRNRIYLAGHSMGGFGTWHYGPKYAHLWAAISPNAGGGRPLLNRLEETMTGVYCHHGADDAVVGVGSDRELAKQMRDKGMDFVYCELPDSGHGWPDEVRAEMWEFFKVRRLAIAPGRAEKGKFAITEEAASSFLDKPSKRELAAFGPLSAAPVGASGAVDPQQLLVDLAAGGGRAERAAAELATRSEPELAASVAKILADQKQAPDARRFAAEALRGMNQPTPLKVLRKATLDADLGVLRAAGIALGKLRDPEAAKSFDAAARHLLSLFQSKKTGARIDFTDFEAHLHAATGLAEGITQAAVPATLSALQALADGLLFAPLEVPTSTRAGQDARVPRLALARSLVEACATLPGPSTHSLLDALAAKPELGVADRVAEIKAGG